MPKQVLLCIFILTAAGSTWSHSTVVAQSPVRITVAVRTASDAVQYVVEWARPDGERLAQALADSLQRSKRGTSPCSPEGSEVGIVQLFVDGQLRASRVTSVRSDVALHSYYYPRLESTVQKVVHILEQPTTPAEFEMQPLASPCDEQLLTCLSIYPHPIPRDWRCRCYVEYCWCDCSGDPLMCVWCWIVC